MRATTSLLRFITAAAFSFAPLFVAATHSAFAVDIPEQLKGASITEHPGESLFMPSTGIKEATFKDESGQPVKLEQYFNHGKPVVIVLAYYECPNLCTFVLNGLVESMRGLSPEGWVPGKQFEVVTLSINPKEGPELAARKKAAYLATYGKPEAAAGWHFLTGDEAGIRKVADAIGFGYKWDPEEKQYAHSAAIFAITPDGRISRTLYGIEYKPRDLKLALLEASDGKIGTVVDRFLLFCYRYDPKTRKYSVYLTQVMQAGGAGTVLVFGGYLAVFWRRQRRNYHQDSPSAGRSNEEPHKNV
jgi:protein SCO1/2